MDETHHRILAIWAADCAEHVLEYFEQKYSDDRRPREAIEAACAWARGDVKTDAARPAAFAAHAAAREADDVAAISAARAAGHAAATAHVPSHAVHAATYAAKATSDAMAEREWQKQRLSQLETEKGITLDFQALSLRSDRR